MVDPLAVIHLSGIDALNFMISSLLEIIVSYILPFGCRCYYFRHGDKSGPCHSLQRLKLRNHVFYFIQLTFKQPPVASATILQSSYHTIQLKTKETNSLLFKCQNPPLSSIILCYLEAERQRRPHTGPALGDELQQCQTSAPVTGWELLVQPL